MTMDTRIHHRFVSPKTDGPDASLLQPSHQNEPLLGNNLGIFNVQDYADGVGSGLESSDDGPAVSGTYAEADAYLAATGLPGAILWMPSLLYRIKTPIVRKPFITNIGIGAYLKGPITGAGPIRTPTAAAGATDIDAQTAGGCFTDDAGEFGDVRGGGFIGHTFGGFRFAAVSKCQAWFGPLFRDLTFEDCNAGIFVYQAGQGHRVENCVSVGGAAGTTYIALATAYAATHPYAGRDSFYDDNFMYCNHGSSTDNSIDNPDFDDWFRDSILRPTIASVTIAGSLVWEFGGELAKPSGRNIYIPSRNGRGVYGLSIEGGAGSYACPRGVALVGQPVNGQFKNLKGETMFALGSDAMVNVLVRSSGISASFESIDGLNTTNPGKAIKINSGGGGLGTFYNLGNILGEIDDPQGSFVGGQQVLSSAVTESQTFDASRNDSLLSTRTVAAITVTIANPTGPKDGQKATVAVYNNTAGATTTSWGAQWHLAGAWVDPAAGKTRTITFEWSASRTGFFEVSRSAADIT